MTLPRIKTFNDYRIDGQNAVVTCPSRGARIHEMTAPPEMARLAPARANLLI
jgi:hypothetical protein